MSERKRKRSNQNSRLLVLHILELLNKYADKDHPMSQATLMELLEKDYGELIVRRTCYDYLRELRDAGFIKGKRGVYFNNVFSYREFRTLIDNVMFFKGLPQLEADALIAKLRSLAGFSLKDKARNFTYVESLHRTENNDLYRILDLIDEAIENDQRIKISRFHSNGKVGEAIITDPYFIVSDMGRYYLLGSFERNGKLSLEPRRVDRIAEVELLDEKRVSLIDIAGVDFELSNYMREHFYMFSGDTGMAKLEISKNALTYFEDWAGRDYVILDEDKNNLIISFVTNYDALYFWALQYGEYAKIIEPLSLKNRLVAGLNKMIKKYEEK